jgi:putative MATE family efflux protein
MKNNLTEGNILKKLIILAIPIMGTSLVQMAYSMTDMFWVGYLGSKEVTAVGTAGFFTWLAAAFITIPRIGAEVGVAQAVGSKSEGEEKSYIRHSIQIVIFFAIMYGLVMIIFRKNLVSFFNLGDSNIIKMTISYIAIVGAGMLFFFIPPVLTGIYNGHGDSKTPFIINSIGLITNMILDPFLITGAGPFPKLGVAGAAIATIFAQFVVSSIFIVITFKRTNYFKSINFIKTPDLGHVGRIMKLGMPAALQSAAFTIIAMIIARILTKWGSTPIAVQSVGSQIESISWLTAGGFQTALSAFVGQNYGAKKWDRIYKGYFSALGIISVIGILTSLMLILLPGPIFSIFIREPEVVRDGIIYLRILGLSQFFMCIEIATAGAFNGLGKTIPPSAVGISMNVLRIPGAIILSSMFGLQGVWWSISISSILKGIILTSWFVIYLKAHPIIKENRKNLLNSTSL